MKDHLAAKIWNVLANIQNLPAWEFFPVVVMVAATIIMWKITEG